MGLPTISLAELEQNASSKSCYVTIGSKVYDVTPFISDHPGGGDLILEYAGKDVTAILTDEVSHMHSDAAYEILDDYHIGFLPQGHIPASVGGLLPPSPPGSPSNLSIKEVECEEDLSVPTDLVNDYKVHRFLDLNRPLFMQVWGGGFSKKFYLEQVHKPRHYKGGESAPLFGNFLEPLSCTPWYVIPIIWLPCVGYGLWEANKGFSSPAITGLFWVFGVMVWTLLEYFLHRFLFHVDEKMPDNRVFITGHFLLHGIHHYLPMDRLRLVMPPTLFVILATPFWKLAHTIFYRNWYMGTAVYCGGIFGYICYDLTHYFLHHKNLPSYYKELKKYHLRHHFADFQKGFGVTSKFWDKVFGTELIYTGSMAKKAE
ncbi:Inositolphosphorylceramide-B hydroxylase [Wilcoxina mikolae CBS 423.85]|nr:Inositolphosphorylceramide-B hydroxylase [Wilcoxina mikolae CBS 423.85]